MKPISFLVLLSTLTAVTTAKNVPPPAQESLEPSCRDEGKVDVVMSVMTDLYPQDTGISLDCNGSNVLTVDPGDLKRSYTLVTRKRCVESTVRCDVTFTDLWKDGLRGGDDPGWLAVDVGGERIYYFDGAEGAFSTLSKCFGGDCFEEQGAEAPTEVCDVVDVSVTLDSYPSETGFRVVCPGRDSAMIFSYPQGTFQPEDKFKTITDYVGCFNYEEDCCTFILDDSSTFKDGLTGSEEGEWGGFTLVLNNAIELVSYNGQTGQEFEELKFKFGNGC